MDVRRASKPSTRNRLAQKGFDFLLNDNTYLKVREGEHDDR